MLSLHAISAACRPDPIALKAIDLIDPDDLAVFPSWYTKPNFEALSFKPGKAAYRIEHRLLSGRLQDTQENGNGSGDLFRYTLTATVRQVRYDVEFLRAKLANRPIHVVATYNSGRMRFVPYMLLRSASDSGARGASVENGYSFTGAARMRRPAPFIDDAFTSIINVPEVPAPVPPVTGDVQIVEITTGGGSTYTYTVPTGKLLSAVVLKSASAQNVSLGLTPGGSELGGPVYLLANQWGILGDNLLYLDSSTPVYFSGLVGVNTIRIYLI